MVIQGNEKRRVINEAIAAVGEESRETRISDTVKEKQADEITKRCPNNLCGTRFDRKSRKCPNCGTFFENPEVKPAESENKSWSSDHHYKHVHSMHPSERHESILLDPVLGNPASRENILAVAHHVKECANIGKNTCKLPAINDENKREESRQWTFMSGDAAIALQV